MRRWMLGLTLLTLGAGAILLAPNFIGIGCGSKPKTARVQLENLRNALESYRHDVGAYPSSHDGLSSLRRAPDDTDRWAGPYLRDEVPLDPWGRPFFYARTTDGAYEMGTYGSDGTPGGTEESADILLVGNRGREAAAAGPDARAPL